MLGECRVYKRRTQREVKAASRRLRRMTWQDRKMAEKELEVEVRRVKWQDRKTGGREEWWPASTRRLR
jgi:hypothetical protein